ncbi:CAP domain-containing protein [Streptomyces sp. NPDC006172]|uniref:CAP domain-containing protein n=1 Tax=Streptomyces sp. NPDC006172 TaxID=3154470 RepID=UPI00340909D7
MRKHRRQTRHRYAVIGAVTVGALAIPSAAMACPIDPAAVPQVPWRQWVIGGTGAQPAPAAAAPAAAAPAAAPSAAAPSASPAAPSASPASGDVAEVVSLVNSERSKAGCSPLTVNAKLAKAAQDHSADMASHRNMSHTGSDGSDPGARITRAGYAWSTYGENVAYGYSTPEQVMAGWMASPGHKRNILNCAFKEIGVGLAQPGSYWTQDFAAAR